MLPDGRTAFNLIQNATDTGQGSLVFFLFDLLHLDGENLMDLPLVERKTRLAPLLKSASASLRYNDHQVGHGPAFNRLACEPIVAKKGLIAVLGAVSIGGLIIAANHSKGPTPPLSIPRQLQPPSAIPTLPMQMAERSQRMDMIGQILSTLAFGGCRERYHERVRMYCV